MKLNPSFTWLVVASAALTLSLPAQDPNIRVVPTDLFSEERMSVDFWLTRLRARDNWLASVLNQLTPEELKAMGEDTDVLTPLLDMGFFNMEDDGGQRHIRTILQMTKPTTVIEKQGFADFSSLPPVVVEKGKALLIRHEVLKCSSFVAQDGARIILAPYLTKWELEAQTATFGKDVVIDGRGLKGKNGDDGKAGTSGTLGGLYKKGTRAGNGGLGQHGLPGDNGARIAIVVVGEMTVGSLKVLLNGGDGGFGGVGGGGGNGADAIKDHGGSDGGNGALGGNGGDSGSGGQFNLIYGKGQLEGKITAEVQAGKPGLKGVGGSAGPGGKLRKGDPYRFLGLPAGRYRDDPGGDPGLAGENGEDGKRRGVDGTSMMSKINP